MNKQDTAKKLKPWLLKVALPVAIVAIAVIIGNLILNGYFLSNYHNEAKYQITGLAAWVGNREWTLYDPETNAILGVSKTDGEATITDLAATSKFALMHPDWTVRFLVLNTQAEKCQTTDFKKNLADCAEKNITNIKLDHDLNNFLRDWSKALINRQWDKLSASTEYTGSTTLSEELEQWSEGLIAAKYNPETADIYIDIDPTNPADTSKVFVVWQLVNTDTGGTKIISTDMGLIATDGKYGWQFNKAALPRI
jgi:hypothetical protein